ncbi:MAG: winged helix-turn-helix domain-containing protein [Candidatus Helarchaeota archaeon]|nr:winged helix-turn-helix domain-containing protein [Candidatus Helarchaeota archaeon]
MEEKELIKKKLKVSKLEILDKILDKVSNFVRYTEDGEIYFVNPDKLTIIEKIGLYLIVKNYGYNEGTMKEGHATNRELSDNLMLSLKQVGARISDLKKSGYIKTKSRGVHSFFIPKTEKFLNKIKR